MELKTNKAYLPALKAYRSGNIRYILLYGGRAGGRSYFASQIITASLLAGNYFRCAIMRYILGDIRNSIFQEVVDRLEEFGYEDKVNIKEHTLTIENGSNLITGIGFRKSSSDQKAKLKSLANFSCVVVEEADETQEEDFQQLDDSLRKKGVDITVIMMFNLPPKNHWINKRWFNLLPSEIEGFYYPELKDSEKYNTIAIHTTYKDNEIHLNQTTIDNFERYKETRPDHYYNMIKGLVSEGARGRIYKTWKPISVKDFEELPYPSYYGLDFGYTNDPTALSEIKEHNNNIYTRELIYETGLTNQRIGEIMNNLGVSKNANIYADSAEPKSIDELKILGFNVIPASKGADSVRAGVDMLLSKVVHYTENSQNIAKESQEYKWALDKNKEPLNEPIDEFNHILDAIRYGVFTKSKTPYIGF